MKWPKLDGQARSLDTAPMRKRIRFHQITILLLFFLPLIATGAEVSVPELISYYLKHTKKLEEDYSGELKEENQRYLERAKKNLEVYQAQGSLEPALIVKREIDFLEKTLARGNNIPERPSLKELKGAPRLRADRVRHDNEVEKIAAKHLEQTEDSAAKIVNLLEQRIKELTRKGKLEEAKGVQNFIEEVRQKFPEDEKRKQDEEVALAQILTGSTWTYHDLKTYAKDPALLELEEGGLFILADSIEGKWVVTDEKKRIVSFTSVLWPSAVEVVIAENLKTYEGTYLADRTRRYGKLKRRGKTN